MTWRRIPNSGIEEVGPDDARLFCNLIRSYILLLRRRRRLSRDT